MPKFKEKHIENLIQGKKSGKNIGSRSTPHHLYSYEKIKFENAVKKRFLVITQKDRINLTNVWTKYCQAKEWPCYILIKDDLGNAEVTKDLETIFKGSWQESRLHIKNLCLK